MEKENNTQQIIKFDEIKKEWMKNDEFRQAYQDLNFEYEIALELIKARTKADLTQAQIAKVMGTTQSVIARLESGKVSPNIKTLFQYAKATGKHLHVSLLNT